MKIVKNSNGLSVMLPDDVPDTEADKGIPVGIHLSGLDIDLPATFLNDLQAELEKRGLTRKEDYNKPGAYRIMGEALKRVLKVTANQIVDKVREEA